MTVLKEGDLQITIGDAINARKFDDANHGLNNCMKAVDFIVELLDRSCGVFNIASWSNRFPQYPVRRQSTGTTYP